MTTSTDGATLETFVDFLETFAHGDGELLADLTKALATAVKATTNHGGKSTFQVKFTVQQVDESLWGEILIVPTITERPARAPRASHYQTDIETGQISLI